jgi:cleavage and polyadenylation specificity factor subunit 3
MSLRTSQAGNASQSTSQNRPAPAKSSQGQRLAQTTIKILPLGAGNEVGRSCVVTRFRGITIMFDCGVHPAHTGISSLPFFDLVDPAEIDIILVTHFHLDHAGALPYFTERTEFKGQVFMTHPTRAIFRWLLNDYVRVTNVSSENDLYTEKELASCHEKIIAVDYGQEIRAKSVRITAYNAGHVLGAAMFLVSTDEASLLYTGDYSREEDRHLKAAVMPSVPIDVIVSESTYGVQCHQSKEERETRFTRGVSEIVKRGGKCLLPVFALGRAQELLLILDEFWESRRELQGIPIFYASALAKRCMAVYQTYLNMMNDKIQGMAEISNPFHFKHVQAIKSIEAYEDRGPCVMMASPGMLQNGLSRELFEMWCGDKRNGCIIPGYSVEGTLAKEILCEPEEIVSLRGQKLAVRSSIDYVSFSAHVDFIQNAEFIEGCSPSEIVLVHGEGSEMGRLRSALIHRGEMRGEEIVVHTPRNGEWIEIQASGEVSAKLLAEKDLESGFVHITSDGDVSVVDRSSLGKLGLSEIKIVEKQKLRGFSLSLITEKIKELVPETFEVRSTKECMEVEGIKIFEEGDGLSIEWESNFKRDVMANSIIQMINHTTIEGSISLPIFKPKKKKAGRKPTLTKDQVEGVYQLLSNYFEISREGSSLKISEKGNSILIGTSGVTGNKELSDRVKGLIEDICWIIDA